MTCGSKGEEGKVITVGRCIYPHHMPSYLVFCVEIPSSTDSGLRASRCTYGCSCNYSYNCNYMQYSAVQRARARIDTSYAILSAPPVRVLVFADDCSIFLYFPTYTWRYPSSPCWLVHHPSSVHSPDQPMEGPTGDLTGRPPDGETDNKRSD